VADGSCSLVEDVALVGNSASSPVLYTCTQSWEGTRLTDMESIKHRTFTKYERGDWWLMGVVV
jgi:hypothetical protein